METLLQLLRESILIQGTLTLTVVGVALYLMATGQEVPTDLWTLVTLVVGFYFGSKVENAKTRIAKTAQNRRLKL